jgi:hypothetical protein
LLPKLAQTTAGFPPGHALVPHANTPRASITLIAANRHVLWPGTEVSVFGHPAQIPQADYQFDCRASLGDLTSRSGVSRM